MLLDGFDTHSLSEVKEFQVESEVYNAKLDEIPDLKKKLIDNVQSWEVKINGAVSITKDFNLDKF